MKVSSHHAQKTTEKRALLVGIEYINSPHKDVPRLYGIGEDLQRVKKSLVENFFYQDSNILIMTDSTEVIDKPMHPTKENILRELENLVADAKAGDVRLFCFAGHSSQILDLNNDEDDGRDEGVFTLAQLKRLMLTAKLVAPVIIPVDNQGLPVDRKGQPLDPNSTSEEVRKKVQAVICDDDLRKILVAPLQRGVKLVALFDSCTSGTLLDLKCYWSPVRPEKVRDGVDGQRVARNGPKRNRRMNTYLDGPSGRERNVHAARSGTFPPASGRSVIHRLLDMRERLHLGKSRDSQTSEPSVISISCTEDSRTAWTEPGMSLVSVFLELVERPEARNSTWKQLTRQLDQHLCGKRLFKYATMLKSKGLVPNPMKVRKMLNLYHPQLGAESKATYHERVDF
ncbi:hypothetical protein NM688_g2486 [Phlebia brevispora]|uniref:Uncharacterized protein n=1 Tax=Phlebia brevispora TaxID=194682 RepID=A0ACC1T8V2_9APHY|nr:hypothetical protein NM688_g2486 [Phlebia brevispora]